MRRLVARIRTPAQAQRWLHDIDYNREEGGETIRGFHEVLRHKSAHCLEGAMAAAWILERHGWPPLLIDLDSSDGLTHIVFVYRWRGRWGAVGKSKYPGLMGRRPVFRSLRDLAWSYVDPFVDKTGRLIGYSQPVDLRELPGPDWRLARGNLWRVEKAMLDAPHTPLNASEARHRRVKKRYLAWKHAHPGPAQPPVTEYRGHRWMT